MRRVLLAPGRYVQGAGAMKDLGGVLANFGCNALLTGGSRALATCGEAAAASIAAALPEMSPTVALIWAIAILRGIGVTINDPEFRLRQLWLFA